MVDNPFQGPNVPPPCGHAGTHKPRSDSAQSHSTDQPTLQPLDIPNVMGGYVLIML
jgi:hypothetical protein